MKEAWDYDSVTEIAVANVSAIGADAEGICGELRMWYHSEAAGVFRLWQAIVGEAAREGDMRRLQALCDQLSDTPQEDTTGPGVFPPLRVV